MFLDKPARDTQLIGGTKLPERLNVWHRLQPEFGNKRWNIFSRANILTSALMAGPNIPIVYRQRLPAIETAPARKRRCRCIRPVRVKFFNNLRQKIMIDFFAVKFPAFAHLAGCVHPVDLVIAAPEHDARMIAKTFYDILCLFFYFRQKPGLIRIIRTGKHKILPDHYAEPVTKFVKFFRFVISPAPDS